MALPAYFEILVDQVRARRAGLRSPDDAWAAETLVAAIAGAQQRWAEAVLSTPKLRGVGATVAAVLSAPGCFAVAHLGDCAARLLRAGRVVARTANHDLRREAIEKTGRDPGPGQFERCILRGIGFPSPPELSVWRVEPADGLLLTAAVHDLLSDDQLATELARGFSARSSLEHLLRAARSKSSRASLAALYVPALG